MSPQFPRIFFWHVVRNVRHHRLLALLNVLSIALGIAVYLAIQIANHSASSSFGATVDLVAGKAQLEVRGNVPETLWPLLARQPGVKAATGLVEGLASLPDFPGEYLRVMGVDVFSGEPFRTYELGGAGERLDLESWLGRGQGVFIPEDLARKCGVGPGGHLRALVNSEERQLTVLGFLRADDSPAAFGSRLAVMDIGWAQELFATQGRLSSVQLLLEEPGRAPEIAAALQPVLPADLQAQPPRQRSFQLQNLLAAFQLNLTALSMVSMLVGVFLIYNTISASVARRRLEIGILRSIGMTRTEVRCLFLGEACLFGSMGIVLGAIGGVILAHWLVAAVAKTISSLYVLLSLDSGRLHPLQFAAAAVFGFGAVLVGAWLPADEAARIEPVGALSRGAPPGRCGVRRTRWAWLGAAGLGLAAVCSWMALHSGPPLLAFVGAFFTLTGFAFFSPAASVFFARWAARLGPGAVWWRLGADNLGRAVHRNAVTVAALAVAVAMVVGLTVMIHSFRESLDGWINRGVVADLFIAPASNEVIGRSAYVPAPAIQWLAARPEVAMVETFREQTVALERAGAAPRPVLLNVVSGVFRRNFKFSGAFGEREAARVYAGEGVGVSEALARRLGLRDGDRLTLRGPAGPVEVEVLGTYADYVHDQGIMLVHRSLFDRHWAEPGVHSLGIYLRKGGDVEALGDAFRREFSAAGQFALYSNGELRRRIMEVFEQTFAVTYVLRTVAVLVAIGGIFLSVTTLVAEREREIGVLRAIGASVGQVGGALMAEAALIGVLASALGMAAGAVLAVILTLVVNPAFFGWSIHLDFPPGPLAVLPLWIVPACILAAWHPAWRGARRLIAQAIRDE